ncbi:hypothetical protein ACF0H5_017610 [Mactra antiquata]
MNLHKPTLQIFHPSDADKPLYWVSDLAHWKQVFHIAGEDNEKHERQVAKLINDKNVVLKKYKTTEVDSDNTDENNFIDNMRRFIQTLKIEKQEYKQCKQEFYQMEEDIRKYKDKWKEHVKSYDKQLKYVFKKLEKTSKHIELLKKAYYKFKFLADKEAVKIRMSVKQNVSDAAEKRHARAAQIASSYRNAYVRRLESWDTMAADARLLSIEYETAYTEREFTKAERVRTALEKMKNPGKCRDRNIPGTTFTNEALRDLIEHLSTKEANFRTIECPKFQEYDPSRNLTNMYEDAKRELSFEEDGNVNKDTKEELDKDHNIDVDDDSDDNDTARELITDGELNKILEHKKKFQYFIVSKEYTKQNKTEISLKLGERVKQLLPPNENGMAYGKVTHGILNKTKKGFYPVECTKLFMTLNPEDGSKNKSKLKLAKKVQKQVKKMKRKEETTKSSAAGASTSKAKIESQVTTQKNVNGNKDYSANTRKFREIVESVDFSDQDEQMDDILGAHHY